MIETSGGKQEAWCLAPFRALDLCDEKGFFCGKILADLGADVIKIERPGGDPAREIGPFYHDIPDPEKSLYWFAFNSSKRGITLNLETTGGQQIFKRLVKRADFVIESFAPGYMDRLGLGYSNLSDLNPRIILTSITPFGQTGPYKDYKASDIVAMGMGGLMSITGSSDRAPLRLCLDQAYSLAGSYAAVGTMFAHYHRQISGEGQHVDVSLQECIARSFADGPIRWEFEKRPSRRTGDRAGPQGRAVQAIWPCRDGYVTWSFIGGTLAAKENHDLIRWMDEEGMAGVLKGVNFETVHMSKVPKEELHSWEEIVGKFFLKHTKKELEEQALRRRIRLVPLSDVRELMENEQLVARGYWAEVEHLELGTCITYPGHLFLSSDTEGRIRRRAPLVGEHNEEIYEKELGISRENIVALKQANVI